MAKATRATDSTTPKKRSRKTTAVSENGNGTGTKVVESISAVAELASETKATPVLEEKVRARAYELYLKRHGQGGSPEQDWLQALQEIKGQGQETA